MSYVVAVRAMCEFTARRGDLDLRFTPAPTALEGIAGHGAVTSNRGARYETEIALTGTWGTLTVRGRADGYDPVANRLEEIKTYRGSLDAMPDNHRALHWAQAKVYAHLMCDARSLPEIDVALVYFDIVSERETVLTQTLGAAELATFFAEQCACFVGWAERETAHRAARDAALRTLVFPHGRFRSGQRELAVAVYRAARDERCLMAQAPTGIGKTLGTVFPLLKACGELDHVLPDREDARPRARARSGDDARRRHAALLRVLELVARDKACEHPDSACHGESCPLAKGFYDRLPARAMRRSRPGCSTATRCARPRSRTTSARTTCRRSRALVRHGDRRLQLLLRRQRDAARSRSRTSGASACSSTKRTTCSIARGRCTAHRSTVRVRGGPRGCARGTAQGVRPARPRLAGQPRADRALCRVSGDSADRVGRAEPRCGNR